MEEDEEDEEEVWKDIDGFTIQYQISSLGRVRRVTELGFVFLKPNNCNRYTAIGLFKNGKQRQYKIHRLVALSFIPNPENKSQVNHINGDKLNNSISNLEWCTSKENIRHSWDNGLRFFTDKQKKLSSEMCKKRLGINSPCSKRIVSECGNYDFASQREACIFFKVSESHMSNMLNGKKINKYKLNYK